MWGLRSLTVFLLGLAVAPPVLGAMSDAPPLRPVVYRAGYRVLEADFHVHTRLSDGFLSPFDVVLAAERQALDAVAVTEHNMVLPGRLARWFSERTGGPIVLPGQEITTRGMHLLAIGVEARVPTWIAPREMVARVHDQRGIVLAAHPVAHFWPSLDPLIPMLDGMELMHPVRLVRSRGEWNPAQIPLFWERARRRGKILSVVGDSDYHFFKMLGVCRTYVFTRGASAAAILDAVRQGRTVVRDADGALRGDPVLVEALARAPIAPRVQEGYEARGVGDAAGRTVGWITMVVIAFGSAGLRRRRRGR